MKLKTEHFLVHVLGDLEPYIAFEKPASNEIDLEADLIQLVQDTPQLCEGGDDAVYQLTLLNGVPKIYAFSGGYMDNIRRIARDGRRAKLLPAFMPHNPKYQKYKRDDEI